MSGRGEPRERRWGAGGGRRESVGSRSGKLEELVVVAEELLGGDWYACLRLAGSC